MSRIMLFASSLAFTACSGGTDDADTGVDHSDHDHGDHGDLDPSMEKMTDGGTFMVAYSTMPAEIPLNEDFVVMLELTDMDGMPAQATELLVDATMPEHGHGMNVMPMVMDMGDGVWQADGLRFHMEGYWMLEVEVDGEAVTFDIDCCGADEHSM